MDLDTEETRETHNLYIKSIHIHGSLKNSKKNFHQEKLILKVDRSYPDLTKICQERSGIFLILSLTDVYHV